MKTKTGMLSILLVTGITAVFSGPALARVEKVNRFERAVPDLRFATALTAASVLSPSRSGDAFFRPSRRLLLSPPRSYARRVSTVSTVQRRPASTVTRHHPPRELRSAQRLRDRLTLFSGLHGAAPTPAELSHYLRERSELLAKSFTLRLPEGTLDVTSTSSREAAPEFIIVLKDKPQWVVMVRTDDGIHATLDEQRVEQFLEEELRDLLPAPSAAVIQSPPVGDEQHAVVEGIAKTGYDFDVDETVDRILTALSIHQEDNRASVDRDGGDPVAPAVEIAIMHVEASVQDATGYVGELQLLSTGRSKFKGSPVARIDNIHKAVEQHLTNSYIDPGEEFSYARVLGPVTKSRGWKDALGIFNGVDLALTPGGGACQVSTTLYRSVLAAGLPIVQQHNHSIYVGYYADYGEGLDATVFVQWLKDGKLAGKDLVFRNDTNHPLLVQAYVEGDEVTVSIYGRPDGRRVALEGPYRRHNAPESLTATYGKQLPVNAIGWLQTVYRPDGIVEQYARVSRYNKPIPSTLASTRKPLRLAGATAPLSL